MMAYALSLGAGLCVGLAYGAVGVRSPAPPIIALVGLLGMLAGEALVSFVRGHPETFAQFLHTKSFGTGRNVGAASVAARPDDTRPVQERAPRTEVPPA